MTSDPEPLAQSWSAMFVLTELQTAKRALERARDRALAAGNRVSLSFVEEIGVAISHVERLESEVEEG